jgi:PHP family Zn ribbon phosphoesterase
MSPSIETAAKVNKNSRGAGQTCCQTDGAHHRHILKGSSRNAFINRAQFMLIPAHIWTPWFSMFGSKSGFNSIEECFEKKEQKHIYGIETGLLVRPGHELADQGTGKPGPSYPPPTPIPDETRPRSDGSLSPTPKRRLIPIPMPT